MNDDQIIAEVRAELFSRNQRDGGTGREWGVIVPALLRRIDEHEGPPEVAPAPAPSEPCPTRKWGATFVGSSATFVGGALISLEYKKTGVGFLFLPPGFGLDHITRVVETLNAHFSEPTT